jgi:Fic family protein
MNSIRRVTKSSVENLLVSWGSGHEEQIELELSEQPPFMTVRRVAKLLDVSESTIRRYIKHGDLVVIESDGPNSARTVVHKNA